MKYTKDLKVNIHFRVSAKEYKMLKCICSYYNVDASSFLRDFISNEYFLLSDVWGFIGVEDIEDVDK